MSPRAPGGRSIIASIAPAGPAITAFSTCGDGVLTMLPAPAGTGSPLVDDAFLHDERHALQRVDVRDRVAGHADDVRELTGLDAAEPVVDAEVLRRDHRRRADRVEDGHSRLHHVPELLAVAAVR